VLIKKKKKADDLCFAPEREKEDEKDREANKMERAKRELQKLKKKKGEGRRVKTNKNDQLTPSLPLLFQPFRGH